MKCVDVLSSLQNVFLILSKANFSHIAVVCIFFPCHFNYEAEALFDTSHVCYGFPDMLSAGKEELIQWIQYNTRPGAMPTMASVKLSTLHPIVNHPHYEDADLRPGCSMLEIWDVEDPSNSANPPLCSVLLKDERPYFTTVFQNSMYRVLKVNWE
ncbi:hypothetical protein J1605_009746 [Eschrichtius robustus]|uniref:Uncharacterized protein n=1 Tax=Eschrichtius robustus TaxID=9764 RepID=A0AB34GSU5_ESCRO|nr:hypothetical protein J1605_009746 [Eschrichtius robustus]